MNIYQCLKQYYGYDSFRSNQSDIITSLVENNNTIAILPTGGGKSVCFQVPSLMKEGLAIVITPLISLMNDQVYEIKKMNISATLVNSTMSSKEINEIYDNLDKYKFLYLSPERLENKLFLEKIKNIKLSYIIIDEAHCLQTWGSVFRTSYQRISNFTKLFNVPIGLFTATSTKYTLDKMVKILNLQSYNIFQSSLSRNNLLFKVIKTNNKLKILESYLKLDGVKIIYCSTVKTVEYLNSYLNKKFDITMYHGRLDQYSRNKNQTDFISGKIDLIIATNAFGMGINKSDVRYVIHYEISGSIEDYYQEAGRAGRDNKSSKCIVLYDDKDLNVHYYQMELLKKNKKVYLKKQSELKSLKTFINTKKCLENNIKKYFSEKSNKCYKCSNCLSGNPKINISNILLNIYIINKNYNISENNLFLINEKLQFLKNNNNNINDYLIKNKVYINLIFNKNSYKNLKKLNKKIIKQNKMNILTKNIIYKLIYLKPKKIETLIKNEKKLKIIKKYEKEIFDIIEG